ncbi:MAG: hypothetical protein ISR51_01020 [Rhodospirillales bacterium]|nr:hypothetical protein [Alphaproteobacteria bacterium]MBL6947232.1 hypothetical protein [Rhodospirillales bacterium]
MTYDGHAAATLTTLDQPRQQAFFVLAFVAGSGRITGLDRLRVFPSVIVYNPKVRDIVSNPFTFRICAELPFASFRVLHAPLAIVDNSTQIQLVVENSVSALPATIYA